MTLPLFPVSLISVTVSLGKKKKKENKSISHSSLFTQLLPDHIAQALKSLHCSLPVSENPVQDFIVLDGKLTWRKFEVGEHKMFIFQAGFLNLEKLNCQCCRHHDALYCVSVFSELLKFYCDCGCSCTSCTAMPLETEKDGTRKLNYFIILYF